MGTENHENSVRERILFICRNVSNDNVEINEDSLFYRLCYDTFDFVGLVIEIEKNFYINIDDEGYDELSFNTVGEFIDWVLIYV